jgi:hypothetical protein
MHIIENNLGLKKITIFLALILSVFFLIKITLFASDLEVNK